MKYLKLFEKLDFEDLAPSDVDEYLLYKKESGEIIMGNAHWILITDYDRGKEVITVREMVDKIGNIRYGRSISYDNRTSINSGTLNIKHVTNLYSDDTFRFSKIPSSPIIGVTINIPLKDIFNHIRVKFKDISGYAKSCVEGYLRRVNDAYNVNIFLFEISTDRVGDNYVARCVILIQEKLSN